MFTIIKTKKLNKLKLQVTSLKEAVRYYSDLYDEEEARRMEASFDRAKKTTNLTLLYAGTYFIFDKLMFKYDKNHHGQLVVFVNNPDDRKEWVEMKVSEIPDSVLEHFELIIT